LHPPVYLEKLPSRYSHERMVKLPEARGDRSTSFATEGHPGRAAPCPESFPRFIPFLRKKMTASIFRGRQSSTSPRAGRWLKSADCQFAASVSRSSRRLFRLNCCAGTRAPDFQTFLNGAGARSRHPVPNFSQAGFPRQLLRFSSYAPPVFFATCHQHDPGRSGKQQRVAEPGRTGWCHFGEPVWPFDGTQTGQACWSIGPGGTFELHTTASSQSREIFSRQADLPLEVQTGQSAPTGNFLLLSRLQWSMAFNSQRVYAFIGRNEHGEAQPGGSFFTRETAYQTETGTPVFGRPTRFFPLLPQSIHPSFPFITPLVPRKERSQIF